MYAIRLAKECILDVIYAPCNVPIEFLAILHTAYAHSRLRANSQLDVRIEVLNNRLSKKNNNTIEFQYRPGV